MAANIETVRKLAECINETVWHQRVPVEAFGAKVEELRATAEDLAETLALVTIRMSGTALERAVPIIEARISVALTREHVKAQHDISRSAGYLAAASVFLALVTLFGGFV